MKLRILLPFFYLFFGVFLTAQGQDFDSLQNKADMAFMNSKFEQALSDYKTLIALKSGDTIQRANVYSYAALCNEQLGNNKEALVYFKEALLLHVPQLMIYDKMISLAKDEKDNDAYEFALLQKKSEFPDFEISIEESLGYHYYNSKQYDKLLITTKKLTEWYPDNAKFYLFQAVARQNLNDVEGALIDYKKVLSIEPENAGANMGIGVILYNRANKVYDKLKADYDAINNPSRVDYSTYRTKLEKPKAMFEEALTYLLKAYENKAYSSLKGLIRNAYIKVGDKEHADKYL